MLRGERRTSVVPLSLIRMSCHLAPRYQRLSETVRITSEVDLLSVLREFYFNKYSSHFTFTVLEHWRKYGGNCESLTHMCITEV
jgi:hypothetical protein